MRLVEKRNKIQAYMYLSPIIVFALIMLVYPIISSIMLSFQNVKIPAGGVPVKADSLKNYVRMFSDSGFYQSFFNSVIIVSIATAFCMIIGVGVAVLVNGIPILKTLSVLPWAIPSVTAAVTWGWMFDGSFGLLNWLFVKSGIIHSSVIWNQSPFGAIFMVIVVLVWKGYPFITIMVMAGLQSVPDEIYEAADVEGATSWKKLFSITLPLIRPVTTVSGLLTALWIFRDYPIVYLMTGGGPVGRTRTLGLMTYQQAFESFNMGYGAAIGVFTLAICFILAFFVIKLGDE